METTLEKKTWGEREGVTLDLLRKFTAPGSPHFGDVLQVWSYRGDCTESGDRRTREAIGEDAYEHHHYNAEACNGGIVVCVRRWKFREGRATDSGPGLAAEYWWAMQTAAAPEPEEGAGIRIIPPAKCGLVALTRELLTELPGLEYVHVSKVSFYSTRKPGHKQWKKAPSDVRFFRFAAGYGCAALPVPATDH